MLLTNKPAVIYGAAGKIGSAVARAFSREGTKVYLAGRTLAKVRQVADEITSSGGFANAAEVDALDKAAIERHLEAVVASAGSVDITFNAISIRGDLQGTPLVDMTMDEGTVRGRLPTLRELADAAVLAASDRASAMTGAIVNLTCGSILD